jgi:hypothetical protein
MSDSLLMNLRPALLFLTALFVLPVQAESLARTIAALPELSSPPQGEAQWIARTMRMNGLPMTLKAFQSRLDPGAVIAHYQSQLQSQTSHEARRSINPPWQVLMLKSPGYFITVHARAVTRGSEGTILVSPALAPSSLRTRTHFPRPASTRIVNLQQYDDEGLESEHISLTSVRPPFTELQAFSQLLIRDGWTVLDTRATQEARRGYVLEAQRQAEQALLVIVPDAAQPLATAIVIAWKKS